ncbi:PilZ domain-containing protein [Sphingobium sp.]|uniref:PilZ domain-containing protein n=1 Tax=Sphingobium sp. TaxID=1912891 RepID=UPI003BB76D01
MNSAHFRSDVEQRREPRFVANARATIIWDGVSEQVMIRNISVYGALIEGLYLPPIGARLTLIADHLEVTATTIWHDEDRCGLLLAHAVDPLAVIDEPTVRTIEPSPIR